MDEFGRNPYYRMCRDPRIRAREQQERDNFEEIRSDLNNVSNDVTYLKRQMSNTPNVLVITAEQERMKAEIVQLICNITKDQEHEIKKLKYHVKDLEKNRTTDQEHFKQTIDSLVSSAKFAEDRIRKELLTASKPVSLPVSIATTLEKEKVDMDVGIEEDVLHIDTLNFTDDGFVHCNSLVRNLYNLDKNISIDILRVPTPKGIKHKSVLFKTILKTQKYFISDKCFKRTPKGKMIHKRHVPEFVKALKKECPVFTYMEIPFKIREHNLNM